MGLTVRFTSRTGRDFEFLEIRCVYLGRTYGADGAPLPSLMPQEFTVYARPPARLVEGDSGTLVFDAPPDYLEGTATVEKVRPPGRIFEEFTGVTFLFHCRQCRMTAVGAY